MTSQRGVPVGKQRHDIWNIERTDSAVSARRSRNPATGCIKCTKCSVITSLTGRRVGNSATTTGGWQGEGRDSFIAEPPDPPRVIFEIGLLGATSIRDDEVFDEVEYDGAGKSPKLAGRRGVRLPGARERRPGRIFLGFASVVYPRNYALR